MIKPKNEIETFTQEYEPLDIPERHPSLFEPRILVSCIFLAILGVIIGLELLTRVGITANTSIIGAIIIIAISRIPLTVLNSFRSLPRQNLIQTAISGATFGGANAIFLPMAVLWLIGKNELVPAMMCGAVLGLLVDSTILYKVFDSRVFPASRTWPCGIATAECIIAGDRVGKRAKLLGVGGLLGAAGRLLGIPMDIFGVCWIGNIWALTMLGVGLILRGYSLKVFNVDINKLYIPHGVMIGAGLVAMVQIIHVIVKKEKGKNETGEYTTTRKQFGRATWIGFTAYLGAAGILSVVTGVHDDMSFLMLMVFIVFAGVAALVKELIVGISAMHAGWFPSFATSLIFLIVGMLIGFPDVALAVLVGFTLSTGPVFADMAYDLKTGWILRGRGKYPKFEKEGRKQQYFAELLGFTVAAIFIIIFYKNYFTKDLFPPVSRVYVSTIRAGVDLSVEKYLLLWSIPGAIIQLIGGANRQIGILFATGMLIYNPIAGWTAFAALAIRLILVHRFGKSIKNPMYVLAGGFIAGSALCSFGTASLKLK